MTDLVLRLLSFALTTLVLGGIIGICLKFTPNLAAKTRATIWSTLSLGLLSLFTVSVAGRLTGAFDFMPIFERFVMSWLHLTKLGTTTYHFENGFWQPILAGQESVRVLFYIWAAGAIGLLIVRGYQLFLAQQFTVWAEDTSDERMAREAQLMGESFHVSKTPNIRESHLVKSPLVVGILKFTLLMPSGMSRDLTDDELQAILAHEFSHISRRDTRMMALMIIAECVFWFNPATWFIHREWATCRELDADQEAILRSHIEPKRFANLLLSIVTSSKQPWLQTAIGATRDFKALKTRLINMKHPQYSSGKASLRTIATLGIIGLATILPWQMSRAAALTQGSNLIVDGGFENGLDSWLPLAMPEGAVTNIEYGVDTSEKHSGNGSLRFSKTRASFFPVQQMMAKLTSYSMTRKVETTCWVKAKGVKKATISMVFQGSDGGAQWATYVSNEGSGVTHDWQKYRSVLEVPSGTKSIAVFIQMYGPGEVWFDDVTVRFVDDATPVASAISTTSGGDSEDDALADIKDVPNVELQAKKDANKDYFLIGSKGKGPESGYKLLVMLPGGPGNKEFNPFIRRIWKNAGLEKDGWIIAQLVAPAWETGANRIVWPIRSSNVAQAKFKTEEFVNDVIVDVKSKVKVDPEHVYLMGWSSGGPAVYASLLDSSHVKGAFVAMSVFFEQNYPTLKLAKGRSLYLYQSPDDKVTKFFFAEKARDAFKEAGTRVEMVSYPGGHGFTSGQPFEDIKAGLDWLIKR